jgi:hypothetical protein
MRGKVIARVLVACLLLAGAGVAAGQDVPPLRGQGPFPGGRLGGPPPRDAAPEPTGTARVLGRVVSTEGGTPIRRAQVRLNSRDARVNRETTTDNDGRFEIGGLPAARYRLYVSKAGYVTLEYGQARPFETGRPIDLSAGESLEKIDFSLPRGAVVAGRITDEQGDAVTDVQVQAMRYQFVNGERQLTNAGRPSGTDDLGQFRIFGLMPGDYVVRASLRTGNLPEGTTGYPGTYYPGVVDVAEAQTVTVGLGEELSSVAFSLVPARLSRISGTVTGSDGGPLQGGVVQLRTRGGIEPRLTGGSNQVRPDGSFRLLGVPPGDYIIHVLQRPRDVQADAGVERAAPEFGSTAVNVAGDIDGLAIVTTPGVNLTGTLVFRGSNGQSASPRGIQVTTAPPAGVSLSLLPGGAAGARVNTNGTFELRGLVGPRYIRAGGLPAGWAVRSITLDGADITDVVFDFKPGSTPQSVVITLTDRLTQLTGMVRGPNGQPAADYVLLVFPENQALWGGQSRHVAVARPNQNGMFSISGLPPTRYLAVVLPSLENGTQHDAALLSQLRARAQNVTLAEGQTLNLNLEMDAQ